MSKRPKISPTLVTRAQLRRVQDQLQQMALVAVSALRELGKPLTLCVSDLEAVIGASVDTSVDDKAGTITFTLKLKEDGITKDPLQNAPLAITPTVKDAH